jgi:hypothetical protein
MKWIHHYDKSLTRINTVTRTKQYLNIKLLFFLIDKMTDEIFHRTIIILLIIVLIFIILFIRRLNYCSSCGCDIDDNMYGGTLTHYRILFVGTVPMKIDREYIETSTRYKHDPNGMSNFPNIRDFLDRHKGKITYNFLIYDPREENERTFGMGGTIDPIYKDFIYNHNLRNGIPTDLKPYDIVYIDTNTLGFIEPYASRNYWIEFFGPLVKDNGCIISDDDSVLKSTGPGLLGLLGMEVFNGFTGRIPPSSGRFQFTDPVLNDFFKNAVRKRRNIESDGRHITTAILFRTDHPDGKITRNDPLITLKKTWSF